MSKFLNYLLPFLKFGAIFLSALSGCMGLLVDFKKDGQITKWGRRALLGVIISFMISAITQGIEIYRSKQASIAEEKKTQKMLYEISRGIYSIDASKISFDITAEIHMNDRYFDSYNRRVLDALRKYQKNPNLKLPDGVFGILKINGKGEKEQSTSFIIEPESILYPNAQREKSVYDLIGQTAFDISFFKADSSENSKKKEPNLSFSTKRATPQLEYRTDDSTIVLDIKGLQGDLEDYAWRNQGGIESLLDLSNGTVRIALSDFLIDDLNEEGVQASKKILMQCFSLTVSNRNFSSCNLCKKGNQWASYYLTLPANILQTHLNLDCVTQNIKEQW